MAANIGATFLIVLPIPTNIFCINFPKAAKGLKRPSTFSPISVNASTTILAKVFTPSAIGFRILPMPSTTLLNILEDSIALSTPTIKSPILAVKPNSPSPTGEI